MTKRTITQLKADACETPLSSELDVQVQHIIQKTTKSGKPYKELVLTDSSDQFTLKLWENTPQFNTVDTLPEHASLRLHGDWTQNQYGIEGVRWDFRELSAEELAEFLTGDSQTAQRQAKDWSDILQMTSQILDPRLHAICQVFIQEYGDKFRRTAAARKNHHARRGGIIEHVAQMMRCAHAICSVYPKLNKDLLTAGVLFHDCGKLWENTYPETGFTQSYQIHGEMLGHIPLGIELTNKLWQKLLDSETASSWSTLQPSNEDVRLHLLHLIASHHGSYEFGSPTLPRTPEAQALHHIDNLDAKYEMYEQGYRRGQELAPNIVERQFPLPANLIRPLTSFQETAMTDKHTPQEQPIVTATKEEIAPISTPVSVSPKNPQSSQSSQSITPPIQKTQEHPAPAPDTSAAPTSASPSNLAKAPSQPAHTDTQEDENAGHFFENELF